MMLQQMHSMILREGGGSLNSMRWSVIAKRLYKLRGEDPDTKRGRREVTQLRFDDSIPDIAKLPDEQFLELFTSIHRRACMCM